MGIKVVIFGFFTHPNIYFQNEIVLELDILGMEPDPSASVGGGCLIAYYAKTQHTLPWRPEWGNGMEQAAWTLALFAWR